ncbi:hypothetical protein MHU86_18448 [Fragilaria crotonensis]|nr:hypothetical protein MHU86_18448 [Fragilaria crotonensis]
MAPESMALLKDAHRRRDTMLSTPYFASTIPCCIESSRPQAKFPPTTNGDIQLVHPPASRLHGTRAPSHCTYTESEALDLSVRNLTSEWRPEIRRLVERDKRTGLDGTLPFKLSLAQLATTFVEYASEIGRDPPSSQHPPSGRTPTSIIRRIETASPDFVVNVRRHLDDEEINLMVRAISQNQDASSVCLGCQLPGHKLEDCNRFVDYIVAEGLAQRNPQLKAQIANSHKQFRSRLNSANTRNRPPLGANNRVMHRILEDEPANIDVAATNDDDDDGDKDDLVGYQQNSLRATAEDEVDFEACFEAPNVNSISISVADVLPALPTSDTVRLDVASDPILLRRLAETYDRARQLVRTC